MFRDAKAGDRVWSSKCGRTTIVGINVHSSMYPISTENGGYYSLDGYYWQGEKLPSLFWDEVKIIPPPKPKRKVKKVVEGWLRLFEGTGGNLILADKLSDYSVSPGCCIELPGRHCKYLGEVFIHHEYEVEED